MTPTDYPVYPMAILWSIPCRELSAADPVPVDGDAAARAAWRQLTIAQQWQRLNAAQVSKIRNNQADQDKVAPR